MDWMLKNITDYWDWRVDAISTNAKLLDKLSPADYQAAIVAIAEAVTSHAVVLTDEGLANFAFVMVEDLYKSACAIKYYSGSYLDYLEASAGTFCGILTKLGFQIRYTIHNEYEASKFGLNRPVEMLPNWFESAGLKYICPQQIALNVMTDTGHESDAALLPQFIAEARIIADKVVGKCMEARRHYVFLDTDVPFDENTTVESLMQTPALANPTLPGTIWLFRTAAPTAGSQCMLKITPVEQTDKYDGKWHNCDLPIPMFAEGDARYQIDWGVFNGSLVDRRPYLCQLAYMTGYMFAKFSFSARGFGRATADAILHVMERSELIKLTPQNRNQVTDIRRCRDANNNDTWSVTVILGKAVVIVAKKDGGIEYKTLEFIANGNAVEDIPIQLPMDAKMTTNIQIRLLAYNYKNAPPELRSVHLQGCSPEAQRIIISIADSNGTPGTVPG